MQALCSCLLYACCIKQRLAPVDLARLLDLLHHLSLRARVAGGENLAAQHQASMVLLSVLLGVLPLEDAEGETATADEEALRGLASSELGSKVAALSASEDPYAAVVKVAWGVLLLCGEERTTEQGKRTVADGINAGALGFLRSGVAESIWMADESEDTRLTAASVVSRGGPSLEVFVSTVCNDGLGPCTVPHLAAAVPPAQVYQLLGLFTEVAHEALVELRDRSRNRVDEEIEVAARAARGEGGPAERALMAVDHRGGPPAPAPLPPDDLATLLSTLAAVLRIRPALYLDDARRSSEPQPVQALLGGVHNSPEDANVPSVLLAYLEVSPRKSQQSGASRPSARKSDLRTPLARIEQCTTGPAVLASPALLPLVHHALPNVSMCSCSQHWLPTRRERVRCTGSFAPNMLATPSAGVDSLAFCIT